VLPHPPNSPYLALSDYCLFFPLKNSIPYKKFGSLNVTKNRFDQYSVDKSKEFWKNDITRFPER
ncbi:hypothetical protein WH47_02558, partial [Habropoda laboriosa]